MALAWRWVEGWLDTRRPGTLTRLCSMRCWYMCMYMQAYVGGWLDTRRPGTFTRLCSMRCWYMCMYMQVYVGGRMT